MLNVCLLLNKYVKPNIACFTDKTKMSIERVVLS